MTQTVDPALAELKNLLLAAPGRPQLAVAESMTGGRLQARITEISGASGFFLGGVTAYAPAQKVALLGVNEAYASAVNRVSERVAGEMACGACRLFGADLAVSTTGYAEPSPADGVKDPFAWVALAATSGGVPRVLSTLRVDCPGANRTEAQTQVTASALALLIERLRAG